VLLVTAMQHRARAQGVLTASSPRAVLCSIAGCQKAKPAITGFDSNSVFTPGGKFVLHGSNFNSLDGQPGTIVLKIGSKTAVTIIQLGNHGWRQGYTERQATVLGWADSHVGGQIPSDISGVMDGIATLEISRNDGLKSDSFVIHFKAMKDLQILPMTDVSVKTCATHADSNLCNNWSDSSQLSIPPNVFPTPTIYGAHAVFVPVSDYAFSPTGQDYYTFALQNGWEFDNSYWLENGIYYSGSGCTDHMADPKLPSPSSSRLVVVDWRTGCSLQYHISLHITGPKGVPWK